MSLPANFILRFAQARHTMKKTFHPEQKKEKRMRVTVPDYFDQFRCLAGDCPHTCCEKWEVVIDEETAALYGSVPGPLGAAAQGTGEG